jgi:hypothetical protein
MCSFIASALKRLELVVSGSLVCPLQYLHSATWVYDLLLLWLAAQQQDVHSSMQIK